MRSQKSIFCELEGKKRLFKIELLEKVKSNITLLCGNLICKSHHFLYYQLLLMSDKLNSKSIASQDFVRL